MTLLWLITEFGDKGRDFWKTITLSYDNMCKLDSLKVTRSPLPLPGDLKYIWKDISKVIDDLHIKNYVNPKCHTQYSTENLRKEWPNANTMACEQTFAWLSRFKKILCLMDKTHFHFYLHRMVQRRNRYISRRYLLEKRVLSPKPKNKI